MIKKYGKSLNDILDIKESFFNNNDVLLNENLKLANIATQQPKRDKCKNCDNPLKENSDFEKHGIEYKVCNICNHLNSIFQDTEDFAKAIYIDEVTNYSKTYSAEDKRIWLDRVEKIYSHKAKFLKEVLESANESNVTSVMDIGAGSGYFVKALHDIGITDSFGFEVSENQVALSKKMLGGEYVSKIDLNDLKNIIIETESKTISMIGVLEHLTNPREILKAISNNNNIKYIFISLPLFSYTVFFEILNETLFNRHLSGGHTHLYTKESINYFCEEFNFSIIGKWQFGADAMDLYRFLTLNLSDKISDSMLQLFDKKFLEVIDNIQLAFDQSEFSSEIHLVLKNNN